MAARNVEAHAAELHRHATVIDCHSDVLEAISSGMMRLGQRVQVPGPATWEPPPGMKGREGDTIYSPHTSYFGTTGLYDLPRFIEGGITAQVCAVFVGDQQVDRWLQRGMDVVWWMHREVTDNPSFVLATTTEDIRRAKREGKVAGILSFEGCEALGNGPHYLDLYYKLGLRMASLTHSRRNIYADGAQLDIRGGGLTAAGKQLIRRMNELGIVVDLAHINDVGYWEILELAQAPVVISHATPWMFSRGVADAIVGRVGRPGFDRVRDRPRLEALAKNGGVIGAIFFQQETLDDVILSIEVVLDLIGPDHMGLGSDFCGVEFAPKGLEDISKVPAVTRRLVERGHSDETILKILGGNFMRVFQSVWKT